MQLVDVIFDPSRLPYLLDFLGQHDRAHWALFWLEASQFGEPHASSDLAAEAQAIFDKYLCPERASALMRVDLPPPVLAQIRDGLPFRGTFAWALAQLFARLEREWLPRFLESAACERLCAALRAESALDLDGMLAPGVSLRPFEDFLAQRGSAAALGCLRLLRDLRAGRDGREVLRNYLTDDGEVPAAAVLPSTRAAVQVLLERDAPDPFAQARDECVDALRGEFAAFRSSRGFAELVSRRDEDAAPAVRRHKWLQAVVRGDVPAPREELVLVRPGAARRQSRVAVEGRFTVTVSRADVSDDDSSSSASEEEVDGVREACVEVRGELFVVRTAPLEGAEAYDDATLALVQAHALPFAAARMRASRQRSPARQLQRRGSVRSLLAEDVANDDDAAAPAVTVHPFDAPPVFGAVETRWPRDCDDNGVALPTCLCTLAPAPLHRDDDDDRAVQVLLRSLGASAAVEVLEALAVERRVVLLATQLTALTLCGRALLRLLLPLRWTRPCAPLLPAADVPRFLETAGGGGGLLAGVFAPPHDHGLPRAELLAWAAGAAPWTAALCEGAVVVDVDHGAVHWPPGAAALPQPQLDAAPRERLCRELCAALHPDLAAMDQLEDERPRRSREGLAGKAAAASARAWESLLGGAGPSVGLSFGCGPVLTVHVRDFVAAAPPSPEARAMAAGMVHTAAFADVVRERYFPRALQGPPPS